MVKGETKEEQKKADNRICPCKPALEEEIPNDGKCRCGIFCTPEYAQTQQVAFQADEVAHAHSRGLSQEECALLLSKKDIDADELQALLQARQEGVTDFKLVDVREWMEWVSARIVGVDYLVPTTSFYNALSQLDDKKEIPMVVYCHIGSRSAYCQEMMKDLGYKTVVNLSHGIVGYTGDTTSGEA